MAWDSLSRSFLDALLRTPGVSGHEHAVQEVVERFVAPFVDSHRVDVHGNLLASLSAAGGGEGGERGAGELRVLLAGHADQIGMLVSQIDENGFVYTQTVGGWDPQQLIGQPVVIGSARGPVPGVISRKAIHLQDEEERKRVAKNHELWIDLGAASAEQVRQTIEIGDPVTLRLGYETLLGETIAGPAMDDRCGVWVVMEALRRIAAARPAVTVFGVSTVQEEIGLRGAKTAAFGVDPHVAIAVDVTHATDCPGIDRRPLGEIALGKGPVLFRGPNINPEVFRRLIETARRLGLPHQIAALGRAASNDSNSLQITRSGVATGLVAIPNRYMHSAVEMISLADLDAAATLLAEFVGALTPADRFVPGSTSGG